MASLLPEAFKAVRPIEEVSVWDVKAEYAAKMVVQLANQGFKATIATDLERAVREADIVSAATLATEPLIRGAWLSPDTHLDLIGAFTPEMCEADSAAILTAALFIDTEEALIEAGDTVQPMRHGEFNPEFIRGTIANLVDGSMRGRVTEDEVTCFKAVGSALADLVAAEVVCSDVE